MRVVRVYDFGLLGIGMKGMKRKVTRVRMKMGKRKRGQKRVRRIEDSGEEEEVRNGSNGVKTPFKSIQAELSKVLTLIDLVNQIQRSTECGSHSKIYIKKIANNLQKKFRYHQKIKKIPKKFW